MSTETPTQGRVTTEGPEGLCGDPGAVPGAAVASEWERTGKLWEELRQWLRMHNRWTVEINPWGIYDCVVVEARDGRDGNYFDQGRSLEKRLANVLAWLKEQGE